MKSAYPLVPIGELVNSVRKWNPCESTTNQLFTYIDISSINRETKQIEETVEVWTHKAPSRARQIVKGGDILISTVRPNLNAVAYIDNQFNGATASTGFTTLRTKPQKLDSRYLYYWVRTSYFVKDMVRRSTGASYPAVSDSIIKESTIPLPPIEEQRRIAAILDKADAVRRKRQEAIRLTEELLRSAFIEMFGIPDHSSYPVKTFAEVCELITDGAHFTPTYVDQGVPFLRVTDIQTKSIDWKNTKYIPLNEHKELIKRCHPRKGDVLYSKNGTIGIPKLIDWDEEFSIFVSLALLRPKPNVLLGEYLESFLKTPFALRQALSHTKTGTVSNLHLVEIRKVKLPIPSIEVQQEWLERKFKIAKQQSKLIESFTQTNNLFNSLLQRAFRGEL
ncbi:restriction endonuclease subunit S [Aliterella atlantica]|uniref:Type I restriction modification DNA specificity domain-containing protein n=1 Tax=Aliterella atlantica CENA595 TaxID=1618023 RepID=A0A0D8ZVV1_9CYAN|nr:restriction endonuclease subunit S [Aliterella atlantica]KJH72517.1 hypothetical protein UH38_07110 [Aliterella atlantica CENA595]